MEFLKKSFAGLPVWGWGLVIIGGVGIGLAWMYFNNQAGGTAATTTSATPTPLPQSQATGLADNVTGSAGSAGGGYIDTSGYVTQNQLQQAVQSVNQALGSNAVATTASTASGSPPAPTPPSAAPSPAAIAPSVNTPLDNLGKIQGYLAQLKGGGTVQQFGTPGSAQSGYLVTSGNAVASALQALFGAGWSVGKCGTNKFLVKGPKATNVKFGPNCTLVGYG